MLENGVWPCALGAGHDVPNPPGPSREVLGLDGRARPDTPNPPGPSREIVAADRHRIELGSTSDRNRIQIGSKSDRNHIGNRIESYRKSDRNRSNCFGVSSEVLSVP